MLAWVFPFGVVLLVAGYEVVPRVLLAVLTKGRTPSRGLRAVEVWEEIEAELKARDLVREVRCERSESDKERRL